MSLQPRVTDVETLSFCGDVAAVGTFRCPADHPLFEDSGPASGYLMVFPRTSTVIIHETGPVTAAAASAMFYNAGDVYSRRKIDAMDASDWYMIAADVVRSVVERHDAATADREQLFSFVTGPVSPRIYLGQRELHTELSSGEVEDALMVEERIVNIFDAVVRDACQLHGRRGSARTARADDAVERAKTIVASNLGSARSLRSLAASVGSSPFQLCRAFRKTTGYTISAYRHALRLRAALDELCTTRTDLTQIALDLGYSSHSHFTMVFKRHFGITPSSLRQNRTFARSLRTAH